MPLSQNIHIETDVAERIEHYWTFKPSFGAPRNQNFMVLSIVAPDGTSQKTTSTFGIKGFGCFNTLSEANDCCKQLQQECNMFDYFVMDLLEWVKLPPQVEHLSDQHFQEQEMETLKDKVIKMRQVRAKMMEDRLIESKKGTIESGVEETKGGDT